MGRELIQHIVHTRSPVAARRLAFRDGERYEVGNPHARDRKAALGTDKVSGVAAQLYLRIVEHAGQRRNVHGDPAALLGEFGEIGEEGRLARAARSREERRQLGPPAFAEKRPRARIDDLSAAGKVDGNLPEAGGERVLLDAHDISF